MISFRKTHPKRRDVAPKYSRYQRYKSLLKEDFHSRCGYCDDVDSYAGGRRVFHVDHFVPKKHLKNIKETDYSNLVYACPYCNGKKLADWPTNNEVLHNNGKEGYVDPCHEDYCKHFARDADGAILGITELGKYMWMHLELFLRRHAIIWNLNRLDEMISELKNNKNCVNNDALAEFMSDYYNYSKDLHNANNE